MKKTILLILSILFILTGCGNANISENENAIKSLNGFLEYEMSEGWQDMDSDGWRSEIFIKKADGSVGLMVEYTEYSFESPETFIETQKEVFLLNEVDFLEENNFEKNGRTTNYKIYENEIETEKLKFAIGTIEFDKNEDIFLGFTITTVDNEDGMDEAFNILDTINSTNTKLNEERTVVAENEYIEITVQPGWKRLEKSAETSFYKIDQTIFANNYSSTYSKKETDPQNEFEKMYSNFEKDFINDNISIYADISTEDLKDKTITSKVYKVGSEELYLYFNLIDFKDSDLFVLSYYEIVLMDGQFEDIKDGLDKMTKSIKIKDGGEEQFEQDKEKRKNAEIENIEDIIEHYEGDGHDHEHYEGDGHDHEHYEGDGHDHEHYEGDGHEH